VGTAALGRPCRATLVSFSFAAAEILAGCPMFRVFCETWDSTALSLLGILLIHSALSRTPKPKGRTMTIENPRRILGGPNPKATPGHRLQQRRGNIAPPAGRHLTSVILSLVCSGAAATITRRTYAFCFRFRLLCVAGAASSTMLDLSSAAQLHRSFALRLPAAVKLLGLRMTTPRARQSALHVSHIKVANAELF